MVDLNKSHQTFLSLHTLLPLISQSQMALRPRLNEKLIDTAIGSIQSGSRQNIIITRPPANLNIIHSVLQFHQSTPATCCLFKQQQQQHQFHYALRQCLEFHLCHNCFQLQPATIDCVLTHHHLHIYKFH